MGPVKRLVTCLSPQTQSDCICAGETSKAKIQSVKGTSMCLNASKAGEEIVKEGVISKC